MAKAYGQGRNKRSVWVIPTQPFHGAHFAAMPDTLAEICIKAGCPPGGVVLDPFMGSGTTALVARSLGRHFVGCDINPDYVRIASERLAVPWNLDMFYHLAETDPEEWIKERTTDAIS